MSWRDDYWYPYYPPSKPRPVKGGIKAQSKRGDFGAKWWTKRWLEVLESFHIGARLDRGKRYARQGQVLTIEVERGLVRAKVQGSRVKPYDVALQVRPLSDDDWKKLAATLAGQAYFAAKLFAHEMPPDIEQVFQEAGLSLFPSRLGDLATKCSCPDYSNPCKHIAAVYFLLGEEFDRDPFLLFTLRGKRREDLIALLNEAGASVSGLEPAQGPPALPPEPLSVQADSFWQGASAELDHFDFGEVRVPPEPAALPRRLGSVPFWRGDRPFLEAIQPIYAQAAPRGLDTFLGESKAKSNGSAVP